jgi:hypothetical protein
MTSQPPGSDPTAQAAGQGHPTPVAGPALLQEEHRGTHHTDHAGLRLEPTGRNPRHFTLGFHDLDEGIAALIGRRHQVVSNPYHDA